MKKLCIIFAIAAVGVSMLGCSMCCGPYDFDYPTYGGKHERVDRAYGRVGSIFSDPNAGVYGESADSNLIPQPALRSTGSGAEGGDSIDDGMESITPKPVPDSGGPGELPMPDDTDPTASRLWKQRPLRSQFQWR